MSIPELAVVLLVALVVFGPERLPSLARSLGRMFAKFKLFSSKIQEEIEQQCRLAELEDNEHKAKQAEKEYGE